MSDRMPRPLPDDLADLLAIERDAPVPAEVDERLLARVHATVAMETRPPAAAPEPQAHPAATGISKTVVAVATAALLAIGGAIVGSNRGDGDSARWLDPAFAQRELHRPGRLQRWRSTPTEPVALPPAAAPAAADTLAAERRLLDRAQEAILAGDGAAALAAVGEHADRFRRGVLIEEREALHVQALALTGRADEARERGEQFLARYPRSIQRGAVRAALESLP